MLHALQDGKRVAIVINTPALGDTIAAIPTLRKLSKAYNNTKLTVFSSKPFLFENHPLVFEALPLESNLKDQCVVHETFWPIVGTSYDLRGQKVEFRYSNMDIRQFHAVSLGFTLTQEEMDMDLYIEREREIGFEDYVMIHPTHTWPTRTWDQEKWQELVDRLNDKGIPVVAVGRDSKETGTFNVDKPVMELDIKLGLNMLNDPTNDPAELRWMMNHRARAVVTMDSGILHVAGTTDVNIIQLGSSIDNKLRAPYRNGSQDYKYQFIRGGCGLFCSSNMKYNVKVHGNIHGIPPQIHCLENKPTFECHPSVDKIYDAVIGLYDE
jgi:ADP-heptose:LPS heptosyltransferase